jgi:hypothetical protein
LFSSNGLSATAAGTAHGINRRLSMFRNYVETVLRSVLRQKGYSLIIIAGHTLSPAARFVIFQYVAFK